ncbi:MAG: FKBP-type peptidyl-prolyl cis-trans isomerase [Saprospiraceae bacterium]|nr:FKBP-type peptidyl-prolyl cis-trans isomerase [Saprospiraceae bacterium]
MLKYTALFFLLVIGVLSCSKDEDQATIDRNKIEAFLEETQLDAEEHPSGLYFVTEELGDGGHPDITSTVTVRYKGYLLDGTVFDQTEGNETVSFKLMDLIEGWQIGIPLIQKGGSITLILPSDLAYGNRGFLANEVLLFDIELVDFN